MTKVILHGLSSSQLWLGTLCRSRCGERCKIHTKPGLLVTLHLNGQPEVSQLHRCPLHLTGQQQVLRLRDRKKEFVFKPGLI